MKMIIIITLIVAAIAIAVAIVMSKKNTPIPTPTPEYPKVNNKPANVSLVSADGKMFTAVNQPKDVVYLKSNTNSPLQESFKSIPFLGVYLDKKENKYKMVNLVCTESNTNTMSFFQSDLVSGQQINTEYINTNVDKIDLFYLEKLPYQMVLKPGNDMFFTFSGYCFAYGNEDAPIGDKNQEVLIVAENEDGSIIPIYTPLLKVVKDPDGIHLVFGYLNCIPWLEYNYKYKLQRGQFYSIA